jgi:hypothetical protein
MIIFPKQDASRIHGGALQAWGQPIADDTEPEISAIFEHLETATNGIAFLVWFLQILVKELSPLARQQARGAYALCAIILDFPANHAKTPVSSVRQCAVVTVFNETRFDLGDGRTGEEAPPVVNCRMPP